MGMPLALEHVPQGGAMWTPAITTLCKRKSNMSHACLCDKSSCTSLHRGVWRFLSWSTAMMLYPSCLTASESFALPVHNSTKTGDWFPFGTCSESNEPVKTSPCSQFDSGRGSVTGISFWQKDELRGLCLNPTASSLLSVCSQSLLARVHSTAGCCTWHPFTAHA